MKRSPLARKTPLARGTATLTRTAIKPGKGKARPKVPDGARREAFRRSGRQCIVCRRRGQLQAHHVLPVREWPELAALAANMVGVCAGCHDAHERAARRIRWEELPACAVTLAQATSGAAAVFLEHTYPRAPAPVKWPPAMRTYPR
jgi:AhpD family alkylhydroperoxidase